MSGTAPRKRGRARSREAARLDELQVQADYARQRLDLYRAKAYGSHLTSPERMAELERENERAYARLRFAQAQARGQAQAQTQAQAQSQAGRESEAAGKAEPATEDPGEPGAG